MWLLETAVRQAMERAAAAGAAPTVAQQGEYVARIQADTGRVLTLAGSSAEIEVYGVLTKVPDFFAAYFGGGNTTYGEIVAAIAQAEQDDEVEEITLMVDSPGGTFDGLFDAIAAIQTARKPIKARVSGLAASAAYALVAQCEEITVVNRATMVGSIGVVVDMQVFESVISISSTAAPKKRPDVTTEEGKAVVREELDALHEIFVDSIATGRGTTVEKINAEYGQGATILAEEALNRGMIDAIAASPSKAVELAKPKAVNNDGNQSEASRMDLNELKASHPDVYAAAVAEGTTAERDRVTAHLTLGEASGAMKTAVAAVTDGSGMTATLQAQYMAAGMNRGDLDAAGDDDAAAAAATAAAKAKAEGPDAGDAVADSVEAMLGVSANA